MRKWIPVVLGLVGGVCAGLWYGQQPPSSLPWFANAVGLIAIGVVRIIGRIFSAGEWAGFVLSYPAFLVAWALIGGLLGFVVRWIFVRRRHDKV
jgi:hypothetical protein